MKNKALFIAVILIASACASFASDLPLVELIDPRSPSKDVDGVLTTKDGRKVQAHLRTFGSERIEQARDYAKSIARNQDKERLVREKAFELFPSDPFFQRAFRQFASTP